MQLEYPSLKYKKSYLGSLGEFQKEGRNLEINANELKNNFENFLTSIQDESRGKNLKGGRVPQTTFWAIEGEEYVGRISIRHHLNDHLKVVGGHIGYEVRPSKRNLGHGTQMLKQVLPKAKELGIIKALVTCDSDNVASRKIIEGSGGVLEDKATTESNKPTKLRFWIDLSD